MGNWQTYLLRGDRRRQIAHAQALVVVIGCAAKIQIGAADDRPLFREFGQFLVAQTGKGRQDGCHLPQHQDRGAPFQVLVQALADLRFNRKISPRTGPGGTAM